MTLKALLGGELQGDAPVRFIYVDEAGTSAKEPVSIVVGLVVHADQQWLPAAQMVQYLRTTVPEKFRNEIFHAKTIWGDEKYRADWSMAARIEFLCNLMSIPNRARFTLSWAMVKRETVIDVPPGYTLAQAQHAYAFLNCLATADAFIRNGAPGELATVVAEDVPRMREFLGVALNMIRARPHIIVDSTTGQSIEQRVTQVVDEIHFASKREAILLQVADACAFAFRRYFSVQSHGETFASAVTGGADLAVLKRSPEAKSGGGLLVPGPMISSESSGGQSS